MNRFEKLCWLEDTCSQDFLKEVLLLELVRWMDEDEFEAFYNHLCRNWVIARDAEEIARGSTTSTGTAPRSEQKKLSS